MQPLPGQRLVCTRWDTLGHPGTPWDTRTDLSAHRWTQWWDTRTAQHRTQWSPVGGHEAPRVLSVLWRVGQTEARSYLPIEHLHPISNVPLARGPRSKAITAQAPLAEIATDDADCKQCPGQQVHRLQLTDKGVFVGGLIMISCI